MSLWQSKSVIVAGGAGFIGHHLVAALLNGGVRVHVVDDFSTGQKARLDPLLAKHGKRLSVTDLDVSVLADMPNVDLIYNLASPASPEHYQANPIQTWKSNVLGVMHLMEHAMGCGAILVQASTSEVYGDPLSHPQKETDWGNVNPIGPRACYDESKRAAEALLTDAVRMMGADIRIARIFNTYGPGMSIKDGRAIPNFLAQAMAGQQLTIHGDGSQTRSFCYVSDTVDALLRLGRSSAAKGEVINIGNPSEVTILQIAQRINAIVGNDAGIAFHPRPVDDPTRRRPDIAKARRILDWSPIVALDDGLQRLVLSHAGSQAIA